MLGGEETPEQKKATGQGAGAGTLLSVVVVVAALYFARAIFIPVALATLVAFLLAPIVNRLRVWGWGRVPSALLSVLFAVAVVVVLSTLLASQLSDLSHKLPGYQQNIHQKIETIRHSRAGIVKQVSRLAANLSQEFRQPTQTPPPGEEKPVPVEIRRPFFSPLEAIQTVLGSLLKILTVVGIAAVFVIFMLVEQEDLRDRFICLVGAAQLAETTRLLEDAAERVSRYLLAQAVINAGYGVAAALALWAIGIPNPWLWGLCAALFRYIPYVGIWVAAVMPATLAFAVEPGWARALLIFGLYFGIDLVMYNFVEPLLYGNSTGISPLAILVAAVFWAWLWGLVGLLLATPLTVCLVVLGRHVPNLGFLKILLSDEPVLSPPMRFYQRLLAKDLREATAVAEAALKQHSLPEVFDGVILPALGLAEADRHRGRLKGDQQQFVYSQMRMLVTQLAKRAADPAQFPASVSGQPRPANQGRPERKPETNGSRSVVCVPAWDEADELAALMLVRLLEQRGVSAEALPRESRGADGWHPVNWDDSALACVCAVPPFAYNQVRHLCRRLRQEFQDVKLVAAFLNGQNREDLQRRQPSIPAQELAVNLSQALGAILPLLEGGPRVDKPAANAGAS